MPEFRHEPCSDRWVIIAEDRASRPSEFLWQPTRQPFDRCPFCAGNEVETPNAVAVYPALATASNWQVRVIPNKYPAVVATREPPASTSPIFAGQTALGVHEVIIESPRHLASFADLSEEQASWAVQAYRDRLHKASQIPGVSFGLIFKNCRGAGGATLEHAHTQLLATSILPTDSDRELRGFQQHFENAGRCLVCDLAYAEQQASLRIVAQTNQLVAYCPYASRFPYEIWITPRHHASRFETTGSDIVQEAARLLRQLLRALEGMFPELPYNFWIQTAPFGANSENSFHWRLIIISRLTTQAGFEWGSGCFVNPVSPETAAAQLREALQSAS